MLRILSVAALVVIVAAGCGGSGRPARSAASGVPRALASEWAARASAVAAVAAAGNNCRASQLAVALRDEVIAEESKVPARLQPPLLAGVNALADRIVCPPPKVTAPPGPKKPPKPQPPHKHDQGGHNGHQDKQG
jgi:hypothetical protein